MTNIKVKVFETDKKGHKTEESPYLCAPHPFWVFRQ